MTMRMISLIVLLSLVGSMIIRVEARVLLDETEVVFASRSEHEVLYHGKRIRWSTNKFAGDVKREVPGGPDTAHHGMPPQSP